MSDDAQPPAGGGGSGKPRQLGRGLSALLGDVPPPAQAAEAPAPRATNTLPIAHLHPGSSQPRRNFDDVELDALAASIAERGILQPILVRPDAKQPGEFEIIAGERRWRAAQKARLHEVPVIIREMDDESALEVALVENVQRQDLNVMEEAEGYRRLMDEFGHTQETLAKAVGKARSHIANIVRLLNLPDEVRRMVRDGVLSFGHARALGGAPDAVALALRVARDGLNVRQTEKLAREAEGGGKAHAPKPPKQKDRDTIALEQALSDLLGLHVTIDGAGEKGKLVIQYDKLEQLDMVIARLGHS
jgi:ParB family chromosome partitioning protein